MTEQSKKETTTLGVQVPKADAEAIRELAKLSGGSVSDILRALLDTDMNKIEAGLAYWRKIRGEDHGLFGPQEGDAHKQEALKPRGKTVSVSGRGVKA